MTKRIFCAMVISIFVFTAVGDVQAGVDNYLRLDFDDLGTTLWWVGEFSINDWMSWLTDCIIYVNGNFAEIDTGPKFSLFNGQFFINPTIGLEIDWLEDTGEFDLPYVVPSLFFTLATDQWYGESWTQFFGAVSHEADSSLYLRNFAYRRVVQGENWALGLGPLVEATLLGDESDVRYSGLAALEVGSAILMVSGGVNKEEEGVARASVIYSF